MFLVDYKLYCQIRGFLGIEIRIVFVRIQRFHEVWYKIVNLVLGHSFSHRFLCLESPSVGIFEVKRSQNYQSVKTLPWSILSKLTIRKFSQLLLTKIYRSIRKLMFRQSQKAIEPPFKNAIIILRGVHYFYTLASIPLTSVKRFVKYWNFDRESLSQILNHFEYILFVVSSGGSPL